MRSRKGSILAVQSIGAQNVKFSFKHLDTTNNKYADEFREQNNEEGRHSHYFPDTSEPDGFTCLNDPEGLEMEEAWQIRLCPDDHTPPASAWRVHGVLLADVFYIVWLDYDHALYQNPKFGPGM